ncbi:coagulation factor 5/8 type domain protein [Oceanithermus profundus DSM 14977]|uniref:Coagulation factor 5/8 type domain protein n=1 Tax=Oceanithermus profundus (strain DSM 14977 / NBRC 100410 / VKM B-2274 / 506) TaxID=670487 RepID=E4U9A8_OCEP5|nr:discoidin domain-containing protein [Oceanithermus profundus]ADR36937.1 coagulation factor 5/8 type domain protein [Oceanithermus profundus DSM 14977]
MRFVSVVTLIAGFLGAAYAVPPVVEPVEPFLAAPPEVRFGPEGQAWLELATTIDLACVVVYGEDEGFGRMALDAAMGAAAHREHRIAFGRLEPGRSYAYRLQGSDPSGRLFASRTYRFTAPRASAAAPLNLARLGLGARVAAVSSNYGGAANDARWGANAALDGDPATEWSSDGDGDAAFLTVELPREVEVAAFGFWTRTMGSSAQVRSFVVEDEAGRVYGPFELDGAERMDLFPVENARGRRFTFRVRSSSGGNTGAVEVGVFAKP